jgi:beta-galactosidase
MTSRDYAPSWMKLQDLFITNTWRSWRTMGITGGMIPWDRGYARLDGKLTVAGQAIRASNSDTLAWIAGAAQTGDIAAFTSKDHSFFAGRNDSQASRFAQRQPRAQPYTLRWTRHAEQQGDWQRRKERQPGCGPNTASCPLSSRRPPQRAKSAARFSRSHHRQQQALRPLRFPRLAARRGFKATSPPSIPEGKTTAMLRALGYTVSPWNGAQVLHCW